MSTTLLLTLIVVGVAILLLGVRVFFSKRWGFPNTHVDGNTRFQEKGLTCHRHQHAAAQSEKNLFDRIEEEERYR